MSLRYQASFKRVWFRLFGRLFYVGYHPNGELPKGGGSEGRKMLRVGNILLMTKGGKL